MGPPKPPAAVDIVVPLYRERAALPALAAALAPVARALAAHVILVDDGSADGTAELCRDLLAAGTLPGALLRHRCNLGLSAALVTGFAAGRAPITCWLDADLSYAADFLPALVAGVEDGADLALASPYHPGGSTESVPALRLLLSKGLSRACSLLHDRNCYTWSSMVRAWRRDLLARCLPARRGHLGVTESLLRAHALRARIVEVPATLRGRTRGRSGMRLLPTALGQLGLLKASVLGELEPR